MLELTEGAPPHADIPPINVISVIPERRAPTFSVPSRWSKYAKAFLSRMCDKDPETRRTAERLMRHPFIRAHVEKARLGEHTLLRSLADECYESIQEARMDLDELDEGSDNDNESVLKDEESVYDSSSDEDAVIINNKRNWKRTRAPTDASFDSVLVDKSKLESNSKLRRHKRRTKLARMKTASTQSTLHVRKTRIYKKRSMMKRNKLELNMEEIDIHGQDRATKQKAQDLLQKIMNLTNKKQL